jgi:hypothetical protein
VKSHEPEAVRPLVVSEGQRLRFERRKTQWHGWLWCTTEAGEAGWVPDGWVTIQGGNCVMKRDYDASELTVKVGDTLDAELTESGWLLGGHEAGRRGWVPLDCVEPWEE